MLKVKIFTTGPLLNNCYLVFDEASGESAVIDAPIGSETVAEIMRALALSPKYLIATHCHFDHIFNAHLFKNLYKVPFMYHKLDELFVVRFKESAEAFGFMPKHTPPLADSYLSEGDELDLGNEKLRIIETPGHSPGSVSIVTSAGAFVGDVLFKGGIGRYDLPGANPSDLYHSLVNKLFALPDETIVFPGHGEETQIGVEKATNFFIDMLKSELESALS